MAIFVGVFLYRWFATGEETEETVARKCLEYLETRNARGLLRCMTSEERNLLEVDEDKLDVFLNQFFWKRLEGFKPQGDAEVSRYSLGVSISRRCAHPDGRQLALEMGVYKTDEGPKGVGLILRVYHMALRTYITKDQKIANVLEYKAYAPPGHSLT